MVSKLRPGVIAEKWDEIWPMLKPAYSRFTEEQQEQFKKYLLNSAVRDVMQYWIVMDEHEKPQLLVVTKFVGEAALEERMLLLYGLATVGNNMSEKLWNEAERVITNFAKANGCVRLSAHTTNPAALLRALKMGWKVDSIYMTKDI